MKLETFILLLSAGRIAIGLAPMVAASLSARLLGFPETHDNATARLLGRLFGVRDIGLGVLGIAAVFGVVDLTFAMLFNAATDLADAAMIGVPIVGRQGIDRGAYTSLLFASIGGSAWMLAYSLL